MSGHHEVWTDRLSEYLNGDLSPKHEREVERHLSACEECSNVAEGLREVIGHAAGLSDLEPPRDLWPGIHQGISSSGSAASGADVIPIAADRRGAASARFGSGSRGVFLTRSQLAAAAVLLITVSATATWWVGPGVPPDPTVSAVPVGGSAVSMASNLPVPPDRLAGELADLQGAWDGARGTLDANTLLVLDRNLRVIEQAIEDSYRALAVDPGNQYLESHLERGYERKLEYLREATRVLEWAG